MKYVEDVYNDELLRIKQSFKIKLENLHKDYFDQTEDLSSDESKDSIKELPEQIGIGRQATFKLMRRLSSAIEKEQELAYK